MEGLVERTPRFSICVPVRNGAKYLPHTLRLCVEQQHFDDYEIVVSDNQSTDDIKSIVESFNCEKIKYFRTPKFLGMGANFDYSLDMATGEYRMIIGADDGISRYALYVLDRIIRITGERLIMWNRAEYYWPEHYWFSNEICMYHRHRQNLWRSTDMLKSYCRIFSGAPPHIYDSAVMHKSLITETESRTGRKLHNSFLADFYQAMTTALVAKRYISLRLSLSLYAERPGTAASTITNSLTDEYLKQRHAGDELNALECKNYSDKCIFGRQTHFYIQKNLILCEILEMFNDELSGVKLSVNNKKTIYEMMDEYAYRASIGGSSDEFDTAVKLCWDDVQNSGDTELIEWYERAFIKYPKDSKFFSRLQSFYEHEKKNIYGFILKCDNFDIDNVYDAMILWDKINMTKQSLDTYFSQYEYSFHRAKELCDIIYKKVKGGRLGIFGSGVNGRRLYFAISYFVPDMDFEIVFFDSDIHAQNKKPLEIFETKILPPERIPQESLSAIVTSIYRYDEEIYNTIRDYDKDVEIIRLFKPDEINWMEKLSDGPNL